MGSKKTTQVQGFDISYHLIDNQEFINLTDIAKYKKQSRPEVQIQKWIGANKTLEFLLAWEKKNNPDFKHTEMGVFKGFEKFSAAVISGKTVSPSMWIEYNNAIGIKVIRGRYGGTYAHRNIAFHFATWISAEFYLYVIEEFERLKVEEYQRLGDPFHNKRHLAAGNHTLLVSAILSQVDERLLTHPQPYKSRLPFAAEVDMINKIVFGSTAKEWRLHNADKPINTNQRDFATILDLTILNNLEFLDAMLLQWDCGMEEREAILREAYEFQYPILKRSKTVQRMQELADRQG
ncbi:MAG: KilA-N domain-containing protein [Saprospiraceae bacterium]